MDLAVAPGERVLLAGPSGGGKSTLLRALAGVLTTSESGDLTGTVTRGGAVVDGSATPPPVGLLLQEPDDALVAARVDRDVAFGPENLALPRPEIRERVADALAAVEFPYPGSHRTAALSGGERQRLALAGALAMRPPLLLLDEPLAMLDPDAADTVRAAVLAAVADRSRALVVVDHQLERWVGVVDRLVVLSADGRVVTDGEPGLVLSRERASLAAAGVWVPGAATPEPVAVDPALVSAAGPLPRPGQPALWTESAGVRRRGADRQALSGVSVRVAAGRVTALSGASGAGKSTLAGVLAGLARPSAGRVGVHPVLAGDRTAPLDRWRSRELADRFGWVQQHPGRGFVARSVGAEVAATGRALGRPDQERTEGLLAALGLAGRERADPHRLSGGEQRRLALAAAVAHGPAVLVLDEPTVGQDRSTWAAVAGIAAAARAAGVAVVTCTHDRRLVDTLADTEVRLADGRVVDSRATADRPGTVRPDTDRPDTDRPGTDRPGTDRSGTDRPGADRPGADGRVAGGRVVGGRVVGGAAR